MKDKVIETSIVEKTAIYDDKQKNRYELTIERKGVKGKKILVICINPASNNIEISDTTTNYLMNNLFSMGYSSITICNLYSAITTKLCPAKVTSNEVNMEHIKEVLDNGFDTVLLGYGNTFIGNKTVELEKKKLHSLLEPHKENVVELVDKDEKYKDLKTIHPLYAGQRFSSQWRFRKYSFLKTKEKECDKKEK